MNLIDADSKKTPVSFDLKAFLQILPISLVIYALIYLGGFGIFFAVAGFGLLIFSAFVQLTEQTNLMNGFVRAFELFGQNQTHGLSLHFIIILLTFSFLLLLSAPLLYIHLSVIQWNFVATDEWAQKTVHFLEVLLRTFAFYLILPLMSSAMCYLYFSQQEVATAAHLKEAISKMGTRISKSNRR
jgi:hypothetical protein